MLFLYYCILNIIKQIAASVSREQGENLFVIERGGGAVSWRPDSDILEVSEMWNSFLKSLQNGFGKSLPRRETTIRYHPTKNTMHMNNNNELNEENIKTYWNLLQSNKNSFYMYFFICSKNLINSNQQSWHAHKSDSIHNRSNSSNNDWRNRNRGGRQQMDLHQSRRSVTSIGLV